SFSSLFFISSRRRHTRSKRDWSSDVCSSDLREFQAIEYVNGKTYFVPAIGIGIKNPQSGNIIPSPLSNFVKREYRQRGKSISSQRNCAYAVTRFLNFVHNHINEGDSEDRKSTRL